MTSVFYVPPCSFKIFLTVSLYLKFNFNVLFLKFNMLITFLFSSFKRHAVSRIWNTFPPLLHLANSTQSSRSPSNITGFGPQPSNQDGPGPFLCAPATPCMHRHQPRSQHATPLHTGLSPASVRELCE